jgi:hypothetical protein
MKVKIKMKKEVEVKTLQLKASVRYWEDSEINGDYDTEDGEFIPCKNGDLWSPQIEIETGKIVNWKQGTIAEVHYKVCDLCGWELKDEKGEVVLHAEDGYVPDTLCPNENGFGDYIIMTIDENGFIRNWEFDIDDFLTDNE